MRPKDWSKSRYIRYAAVRLLLISYTVMGFIQLGLAFCLSILLNYWELAGHLFVVGCISIFVTILLAIWEYNLRPEIKDDDESFY